MDTADQSRRRVDRKVGIRQREFALISSAIRRIVPKGKIGTLTILEVGCGACCGAQDLCALGHLVATDIYRDSLLSLPPQAEFRIADIHRTDFADGQFDIIVSNQCLEHLEDLSTAFWEMKRIGKSDAYYAFAVPTATWLILSIPAQILKKFENLYTRGRTRLWPSRVVDVCEISQGSAEERRSGRKERLRRSMLTGHGRYPCFTQCFKAFQVSRWRRELNSNGFDIALEVPLLAYSPSYLPILPPNRILTRLGIVSSYLFLCKNKNRAG